MRLKAVQLLVNSKLPEEYRDYSMPLDGKSLNKVLARVAAEHPDKYEDIAQDLAGIGRNAAFYQGDTIRLSDLKPVIDKRALLQQMDAELDTARQTLPKEEYEKVRLDIWQKYSNLMEKETVGAAVGAGNNLGYSVFSGARGNPTQLKAMLTTPGLYADNKGEAVPMFVRNSFSEGLRPAEYLAGMYGARNSVTSTKVATAKGGDFLKQLTALATRTVVTEKDCGTSNGLDLSVDDDSLVGRVLAQDAGELKAGTALGNKEIAYLRRNKINDVIAKSALTCTAKEGVCALCTGKMMDNKFPKIGDAVGITAAQAIGEPIVQKGLHAKHTGGAAKGKKSFSGFAALNQFAQAPSTFPDRAAVAELDGVVSSVEDAPQGGKYITVGEEKHYVPHGFDVLVKPGDVVEAGDIMSDGLASPKDIVRLKGIGEGRRYYAERFKQILNDSDYGGDAKNVELIARSAVDQVKLTNPEEIDGFESYLPDDEVSYNKIVNAYIPREDTRKTSADKAIGHYLQVPALHYSIGTRITPKVAKRLHKAGMKEIFTSPVKPAFSYDMPNLRTAPHIEEDWIAQQGSSYLTQQLLGSAVRGRDSNLTNNTHFIPRLSIGVGFGDEAEETGKF